MVRSDLPAYDPSADWASLMGTRVAYRIRYTVPHQDSDLAALHVNDLDQAFSEFLDTANVELHDTEIPAVAAGAPAE